MLHALADVGFRMRGTRWETSARNLRERGLVRGLATSAHRVVVYCRLGSVEVWQMDERGNATKWDGYPVEMLGKPPARKSLTYGNWQALERWCL